MRTPPLSIGMPAYNAKKCIGRALESLLAQDFGDFELIVSDNASTDGTGDIVRAYADRDRRIRPLRQPSNLGAHANFGCVLGAARGEYFMFAAADDRWAPQFAGRNLQFLVAHPDHVGSIARVAFEGPADAVAAAAREPGTYPLEGTPAQNLRRYLRGPGANSRYYAVHRRAALARAWIAERFWAVDWAVVLRLLELGRYHEEPEVLMWRGARGESADAYAAIRALGGGALDTWLPMRRFAASALQLEAVRREPRLWLRLGWLNAYSAASVVRRRLRAGAPSR
jgi:glycosyltransferase involved in cell wall biosynthesis